MEYISNCEDNVVENSFDCGENILSLSKQGSLEFDNLFWFLLPYFREPTLHDLQIAYN